MKQKLNELWSKEFKIKPTEAKIRSLTKPRTKHRLKDLFSHFSFTVLTVQKYIGIAGITIKICQTDACFHIHDVDSECISACVLLVTNVFLSKPDNKQENNKEC